MVKKNIVCIVQARMTSRRFPGKVLQLVDNKRSCLEFLIQRLNRSKKISKLVVACTKNSKDLEIIKMLKKNNIDFYRGSENDVLNRYYKTAQKFKADIVVRITSDCPLTDANLIDKMIKVFEKKMLTI